MNKLLKDAIADAKAVRETALANAKVALEEAFAPRLQSMLSHKIKEEMEEEEPIEAESEEEVSMETEGNMYEMDNGVEDDEEAHPVEEGEEVVSAEVEVSDEGSDEEASAEAEEAEMSDDELEEILRELEGEESEEEIDEMEHSAEDATDYDEVSEGEEEAVMAAEDEEEIDLEEIINALREEGEEEAPAEEAPEAEADLEEAYKVIKYLRSKLNEVNLLNAKLLFVNKLFKKGELTENKKIKIIETFDRVRSVREAKLVYATLAESMNTRAPKKQTKRAFKKRRSLKEGFASSSSKPTKKVIKESNNVYNRFTELINYNK